MSTAARHCTRFCRFPLLAPAVLVILAVLAPVGLVAVAWAQESADDLVAATRVVGRGDNPYAEAVVLKNIREISRLHSQGRVTDSDYQQVMMWHQVENLAMAREAAKALKLEVSAQKVDSGKGEYRSGSDSDYQVRRLDGQSVTLENIQSMERAYRQQVNQEVRTRSRKAGRLVAPPVGEFNTSTDIMADPNTTSETEFNRIANYQKGKEDAPARRRGWDP
jgi:hypothetical protein